MKLLPVLLIGVASIAVGDQDIAPVVGYVDSLVAQANQLAVPNQPDLEASLIDTDCHDNSKKPIAVDFVKNVRHVDLLQGFVIQAQAFLDKITTALTFVGDRMLEAKKRITDEQNALERVASEAKTLRGTYAALQADMQRLVAAAKGVVCRGQFGVEILGLADEVKRGLQCGTGTALQLKIDNLSTALMACEKPQGGNAARPRAAGNKVYGSSAAPISPTSAWATMTAVTSAGARAGSLNCTPNPDLKRWDPRLRQLAAQAVLQINAAADMARHDTLDQQVVQMRSSGDDVLRRVTQLQADKQRWTQDIQAAQDKVHILEAQVQRLRKVVTDIAGNKATGQIGLLGTASANIQAAGAVIKNVDKSMYVGCAQWLQGALPIKQK